MSIDKFFRDSIALTLSNMVTGIIGFIFSIVLSRKLGAEGLGLYGLVMPVYGLLLCLTCEGLVTAMSKLSAVYSNKRDFRNLNKTITTILAFTLFWSVFVALVTLLASSSITRYIIKDLRVTDALRIISTALVFVSLSAIFKGCLYGIGKFNIAAYIDIVEKCLRVLVLLGTISMLTLKDVKSMVTAAYFALAIGELVSLLMLYIAFKISKRKNAAPAASKRKSRIQLLFDVLAITVPLSLNGLITSIISTASTLLLPRRLMHAGFTYSSALSVIGKFSGMALNIVYLPFVIIGSMITVLIPDISLKLSRKNIWAIEDRISQILKISILVGIAAGSICLTIPDILGQLFYGRNDLEDMIRFAALAGFTSYVSSPTFGILNALGKQRILLRNSVLISLESLVLIFVLTGIPQLNIYGYGICIIMTSITAFIINMHEIVKTCQVRFPVSDIVGYCLIGILTYILINLASNLMASFPAGIKAASIVALAFISTYLLTSFSDFLNS